MTDRELIEGMKKEEADAERFFRELYEAYTPPCTNLYINMLNQPTRQRR